ncbi:MAG TPA: succinate dehydrogenase, hydrophobic membrane anchor protein [Roseiarcus sp.]|nr:succinate dehydrogenase, hydrophobic membrane anchor protein [Roseiarcus sp.]
MTPDDDSLRSPLARVRYLGSARSGAQESWMMRLSSAILIPLTIAFIWVMLSLVSKSYDGARAEIGRPLPAIIIMLFVLVGIYHMQIGMRSIILDYVHGRAKEWALIGNLFFAGVLALACVYSVLRIGFV